MNADEVADYLKEHPEFFDDYADALAQITLPHPHAGHAIPLVERQVVTLREKNRLLEDKLAELIAFGEENDAIGGKMHRLACALAAARDLDSVLYVVAFHLRDDFDVPHVATRVWGVDAGSSGGEEFTAASGDIHAMADALGEARCGGHVAHEVLEWFGEAGPRLRSFALVPLRFGRTLGLTALASEDPQRFYPEMGIVYLARLGELAGAALARFQSS